MKNVRHLLMSLLLILAASLAACGGSSSNSPQDSGSGGAAQASIGDVEAGKELFAGTCSACHGPGGEGVPGLGKDMTTSEFIAGKTDDELVAFVKVGRDPSDPLNTTGVAMPPKGGNPALSDDDLYDIVAFIRTLHK
jgi:mono/diheme cytochrome c family protein